MVVLYSNHCPLCNRLKEVLDKAKVDYEEVNDIDVMDSLGIDRTPQLGVDVNTDEEVRHILLKYATALKWVSNPDMREKLEQECIVNG
jgi:predicted DCC family thiol-disulfide oxidoreductase YuxK